MTETEIALEAALQRAHRAERRQWHTQQWYAERFERLGDLLKEHGLWEQGAAIIANGTTTGATGDGYQYEPPTYAQQLNIAHHRADVAEERAVKAENALARLEAAR